MAAYKIQVIAWFDLHKNPAHPAIRNRTDAQANKLPAWLFFVFLRDLRAFVLRILSFLKRSAAKPAADARKRSAGAVAVRARKKFVHAPVSPHNTGAYVI